MKISSVEVGRLFQYRRGGNPTIYESAGNGTFRKAGVFLRGKMVLVSVVNRGTFEPDKTGREVKLCRELDVESGDALDGACARSSCQFTTSGGLKFCSLLCRIQAGEDAS